MTGDINQSVNPEWTDTGKVPKTPKEVLEMILSNRIPNHKDWQKWLQKGNKGPEHLGDVQHHQEAIDQYTGIVNVIRALVLERDALVSELEKLKRALERMVRQFAYWDPGAGGYTTGALAELEDAFKLLGWDVPYVREDAQCDEPGCLGQAQAACGFLTKDGYRKTCTDHYKEQEPIHEERAE